MPMNIKLLRQIVTAPFLVTEPCIIPQCLMVRPQTMTLKSC